MREKKTHLSFEEDFSFWDFFNDFMFQGTPPEKDQTPHSALNSDKGVNVSLSAGVMPAENYLNRDTVLTSLARDQFQKNIEAISLPDIEKRLFSLKFEAKDTLLDITRKISRSVVRPLLRSMERTDDEYAAELLSMVDESFHVMLNFSTDNMLWRYVTRRLEEGDNLLTLTIRETNFPDLTIIGTKNTSHAANRKCALFNNGIMVADIAEVFSLLIVLSQIKHELRRLKAKRTHESKTTLYDKLLSEQSHSLDDILNHPCIIVVNSSKKLDSHSILPCVKQWVENLPHVKFVDSYAEACKLLKNAKALEMTEPVILDRYMARKLLCAHFVEIGDFNYHDVVLYKDDVCWPYLIAHEFKYSDGNILASFLCKFFKILYQVKHEHCIMVSYLKENASDYAKSWQQKKNIPKKMLAAMRDSTYNNYFGYVEYDESCDIEKIAENANEFSAVKDNFLPFIDCSRNVIRFRRLGNHKAAGLYYPSLKCLCVDVSNPWSTIHELGHLIDYEYGMLSLQDAFAEIKNFYRLYLSDVSLPQKGKYNLDYYLQPTEVFARAFELYMVYAKGIHNSLVPGTFTKEYCQEERFIAKVTSYFDNLFTDLSAEHKKPA